MVQRRHPEQRCFCLCVICLNIRCIARYAAITEKHCVVGGELSAKAHPRAHRTGPSAFRLIDSGKSSAWFAACSAALKSYSFAVLAPFTDPPHRILF